MPKKFTGENSKSAEARARKADAKNEERARVEKAKEDAYWADDDKQAAKKMQRKEDQEKKRQEAAQKALEKQRLYEEEMNSIPSKSTATKQPTKMTKAQIDAKKQKELELKQQEEEERRRQAQNIVTEDNLHENVNKLVIEGETARTVDQALAVLGDGANSVDRHPEKRMKAAYTAFEERRLAELKIEKPTLRLSQLRQLIKKEWLKSPENPLNEKLLDVGK